MMFVCVCVDMRWCFHSLKFNFKHIVITLLLQSDWYKILKLSEGVVMRTSKLKWGPYDMWVGPTCVAAKRDHAVHVGGFYFISFSFGGFYSLYFSLFWGDFIFFLYLLGGFYFISLFWGILLSFSFGRFYFIFSFLGDFIWFLSL